MSVVQAKGGQFDPFLIKIRHENIMRNGQLGVKMMLKQRFIKDHCPYVEYLKDKTSRNLKIHIQNESRWDDD